MEHVQLSEFIENTLVNIAQGISSANKKLEKIDSKNADLFSLHATKRDNPIAKNIQFDIAVTAVKQNKNETGFVVALVNLGAGAKVERSSENEMCHRIKFEVGIERYHF